MTKVTNIIESAASEAMRFHSFAKEWQSAIVAAWLLKFATAAVSIYAGAHYFTSIVAGAMGGGFVAFGAALLLLALLEVINATALFKGAKFAFRKRIAPAVSAILVACLSFAASYYTSVQGMQAYQADKTGATLTAPIDSTHAATIGAIQASAQAETERLQKAIAQIEANPQGWQDGKRAVLTSSQLATIATYQAQISQTKASAANELKQAKNDLKAETSQAKASAQADGQHYGNIVAILMLVQLAANVLLAFFYSRIFLERERALSDADELKHFASGMFSDMFSDIKNRYATLQVYFSNAASEVFNDAAAQAFEGANLTSNIASNLASTPPSNLASTPPSNHASTPQGIGFARNSGQPTNQGAAPANNPTNNSQLTSIANYYLSTRPALCSDILAQAQGRLQTTNTDLAKRHGCSPATVGNCRRAILER